MCDDALRHTPQVGQREPAAELVEGLILLLFIQAFSHFTFEASCHEQIVVDIQGVGDLYTDPQIHTNLGFEYGGKDWNASSSWSDLRCVDDFQRAIWVFAAWPCSSRRTNAIRSVHV